MVKLSKFPVITPEGEEYRVTLEEVSGGWGFVAKIYVERKGRRIFRFKKITQAYIDSDDGYDWRNPDFIAMASGAVARYKACLVELDARERKRTEVSCRRNTAVEAFAKWDGKISANNEEVSE